MARTTPKTLEEQGLLLSWSLEHQHKRHPIGFNFGEQTNQAYAPNNRFLDPILLESGGHVATIAPTGAGKGVSCIIPNLLHYKGQAVVIDPKGENYAVTAEYRRSLGHEVVVLDPFNITDAPQKGALNPLDLIAVDEAGMLALPDECMALAKVLVEHESKDTFWESSATNLIAAMLGDVAITHGSERNLLTVAERVQGHANQMVKIFHNLDKRTNNLFRAFTAPLMIAPNNTFSSMITVARHQMQAFNKGVAASSLKNTSFSLLDFIAGKPMTIYLVLPPDKLVSHKKLLRLWIASLLKLLLKRNGAPTMPTLLMLDETAQLGRLDELLQAITLLRGYGVQLWTFWQDLHQLQYLYPNNWRTLLNNCRAIQAFGFPNRMACNDIANITGAPMHTDLLDIDRDEMLLQVAGDDAVITQKPNYLTDPLFATRFSPNPFHTELDAKGFLPVQQQRIYIRRPTEEQPPGVVALPQKDTEPKKAEEDAGSTTSSSPSSSAPSSTSSSLAPRPLKRLSTSAKNTLPSHSLTRFTKRIKENPPKPTAKKVRSKRALKGKRG